MFLRDCVFLWLFVNPWLWWGKQNAKRKIFSSNAACPFQIWPKRNKHLSINDGCVKIFVISEVGGRSGIFIPRQTISNNSLWVGVKWSKVMVLGNYLQVSRPPEFFYHELVTQMYKISPSRKWSYLLCIQRVWKSRAKTYFVIHTIFEYRDGTSCYARVEWHLSQHATVMFPL